MRPGRWLSVVLLSPLIGLGGCYLTHERLAEAETPCVEEAELSTPTATPCELETYVLEEGVYDDFSGATIASGPESQLLLWRRGRSAPSREGELVTTVLPAVGPPREPTVFRDDRRAVSEHTAIWSGDGWLGAWTESGEGPLVARFSNFGELQGSATVTGGARGSDLRPMLLQLDEHTVLMSWIVVIDSENTAAYATTIDISTAEPRPDAPVILPFHYAWPRLSRRSRWGPPVILHWSDGSILRLTLTEEGEPDGESEVLVADRAQRFFSHAFRADGGLLAFEKMEEGSTQPRIALLQLSGDGDVVGEAPPIHSTCETGEVPYIVAFQDGYALTYRHTGPEGTIHRLVRLGSRGDLVSQQRVPGLEGDRTGAQLATDAAGDLRFSSIVINSWGATSSIGRVSCTP